MPQHQSQQYQSVPYGQQHQQQQYHHRQNQNQMQYHNNQPHYQQGPSNNQHHDQNQYYEQPKKKGTVNVPIIGKVDKSTIKSAVNIGTTAYMVKNASVKGMVKGHLANKMIKKFL